MARWAVTALADDAGDRALAHHRLTGLMADFLCDLAGEDPVIGWAQRVVRSADVPGPAAKANALLILRRRRVTVTAADYAGQDLQRQDLTGQDLAGARLDGADLSGAVLSQQLRGATLREARLVGVRADRADLTGADLSGADLTGASLLGANLRNARLHDARSTEPCSALRWTPTRQCRWPASPALHCLVRDEALRSPPDTSSRVRPSGATDNNLSIGSPQTPTNKELGYWTLGYTVDLHRRCSSARWLPEFRSSSLLSH